MRKIISHLLLLAVVVSICNAQAQAPARPNMPSRPNPNAGPGAPARPAPPSQTQPNANAPSRPVPNRPNPNTNALPNVPNRQQVTNPRAPNSPTRATPAPSPNRPVQPNRPLPNNPQQGPGVRPPPNGATSRAPVVNNQSSRAPVANVPTRAPPGGQPAATTTPEPATTTRRQVNNQPDENSREVDVDAFPTAPTVAPPPEINFPGQTTRAVVLPILPWVPPSAGRPDTRCSFNENSNNPMQFPHESDCNRFYRCDRGLAFEHQCPSGQHWNARRNLCDFPANANCQVNSNNNNINNMPINPLPINPFPNNRPNTNWNNMPNNWNNIPQWTNPPRNQNPGYEHPIIIPMAPRS